MSVARTPLRMIVWLWSAAKQCKGVGVTALAHMAANSASRTCLLVWLVGPWIAAHAAAAVLPPFSWDRVPVAGDFRTQRALTADEANFIANRYSFVALEKGQGIDSLPAARKHTEDGFAAARRALKAVNPELLVLYYWNSAIYYPMYRVSSEFDREGWCKRRPRRQPQGECWQDTRGRIHFERSNSDFQQWWLRSALSAVQELRADGVFIDAVGREYDSDLAQMLERFTASLNPTGDRLVLLNLAKGLGGSSSAYLSMPGIDGFMIEHFGVLDRSDPKSMKEDMLAVQSAGKRGKVVLFKAWPDFVRRDPRWFFRTRQQRPPYQELVEQARRDITFPLACFLAVAQPYAYFQYSWGYVEPSDGNLIYQAHDDQLDKNWYPELLKALGAPRGDALVEGFRFRRFFAHAEVEVDLVTRKAEIRWSDRRLPSGHAPLRRNLPELK